jgi:hypothetical protein
VKSSKFNGVFDTAVNRQQWFPLFAFFQTNASFAGMILPLTGAV